MTDPELVAFEATLTGLGPGQRANRITGAGFGLVEYAARLNAALDDPSALAAHPILINRLRRIRSLRTRGR